MPEDRIPKATRSQASWHLKLLGTAHLRRGAAALDALERRTAALLAYLAFEGPVTRSKVAGLLWPDSTEDAARANLRQRLKRLRETLGAELILATDQSLRLRPDVTVDAVSLESLAFTGEFDALLHLHGQMLSGHDYDDLPELEIWVLALRERLEAARRAVLTELSARAEGRGAFSLALEYAQRLLETDPVSEDAHRRVMRLHHLLGDRAAALRAYQQCRDTLQRELGVEPLPATLELAGLIARGAVLPEPSAPLRSSLPLSIRRPPLLVGRRREWAQLESAWQRRQAIFIAGPPGVGKTRLMLDFAHRQGGVALLEGRAGDAGIPYATHARSFQRILSQHPSLILEPWMRRELARLDPSLAPDDPPAPLEGDAQKLRFFEAVAQTVRLVSERGVNTIVLDDLQFMDAASFELGGFLTSKSLSEAGSWPRSISAFRSGELSADTQMQLEGMLESGAAALIELEALGAADVSELLGSLTQITGLERLASPLTRYTGGNPLFITETVKHLFETDQLGGDFPLRLPPPGQVGALIRRRLERLSPAALRVAQVAAVAGIDFGVELAARVLNTDALELIPALQELEAAQVVRAERFQHDLLLEATLGSIPSSLKRFLHRRCAQFLEASASEAGRVADHWLEGGDDLQAVPLLIRAAESCEAQGRLLEAQRRFEQAGLALMPSDQTAAFEHLLQASNLALNAAAHLEVERLLALLDGAAAVATQRVDISLMRAEWSRVRGDPLGIERAVQQGLTEFAQGAGPHQRSSLLNLRAIALQDLGQHEAALEVFAECLSSAPDLDVETQAAIQGSRAVSLSRLGRPREAHAMLTVAIGLQPDPHTRARLQINRALTRLELGQLDAQLSDLQAIARDSGQHENTHLNAALGVALAGILSGLEQYAPACTVLHSLTPSASFKSAEALRVWAAVLYQLGDYEAALGHLERLSDSSLPPGSLGLAKLVRARITNDQSDWDAALEWLTRANDGRFLRQYWLARCGSLLADEALVSAQQVLLEAQRLELTGIVLAALVRQAQAQLRLGLFEAAAISSRRAVAMLDNLRAPYIPRLEIMLTQFQTSQAVGDAAARSQLEQMLRSLLETTDQRVPPEYRESFLTKNPVNAAILAAARAADLIAALT